MRNKNLKISLAAALIALPLGGYLAIRAVRADDILRVDPTTGKVIEDSTGKLQSGEFVGRPANPSQSEAFNSQTEVALRIARCESLGYGNCSAAIMLQNILDSSRRSNSASPWLLQIVTMLAVSDLHANTSSTSSSTVTSYPIHLDLQDANHITGQVGDSFRKVDPDSNNGEINLSVKLVNFAPARSNELLKTVAAEISGSIGQDSFSVALIPSCKEDGPSSVQNGKELQCDNDDLLVQTDGGLLQHAELLNTVALADVMGWYGKIKKAGVGLENRVKEEIGLSYSPESTDAQPDLSLTHFVAHNLSARVNSDPIGKDSMSHFEFNWGGPLEIELSTQESTTSDGQTYTSEISGHARLTQDAMVDGRDEVVLTAEPGNPSHFDGYYAVPGVSR